MANVSQVDEFMSEEFPSVEEFGEEDKEQFVTIPWREVDVNIPFEIINTRVVNTKNGDGMVMDLQKVDGTIVKAWATTLIKGKLSVMSKRDAASRRTYILSRGKKIAQKSKNSYYDFKIIYKQ